MAPKYLRVCPDCGNHQELTYRPKKGQQCRSCCGKAKVKVMHLNNRKKDKKTYTHTCKECGATKEFNYSQDRHKTGLCGICSRQQTANTRKERELRYFRICPDCPEDDNTKMVASERNAGIKHCQKHRPKKVYAKRTKPNKPRPKKAKAASKAAIEKAVEVNRKHKEFIASESSRRPVPKQLLTDDEMMAKWLKGHKITKIEPLPQDLSRYKEVIC